MKNNLLGSSFFSFFLDLTLTLVKYHNKVILRLPLNFLYFSIARMLDTAAYMMCGTSQVIKHLGHVRPFFILDFVLDWDMFCKIFLCY